MNYQLCVIDNMLWRPLEETKVGNIANLGLKDFELLIVQSTCSRRAQQVETPAFGRKPCNSRPQIVKSFYLTVRNFSMKIHQPWNNQKMNPIKLVSIAMLTSQKLIYS